MDPMDLNTWRRQWEAFSSAPFACAVFLALGAVAAWWFRGSVLRPQIEGLKEQINALEQRLKLAGEQEQAAIKATQSAKEEIATLKAQTENRVPVGTLATIEGHFDDIGRAQEKVLHTLSSSAMFTKRLGENWGAPLDLSRVNVTGQSSDRSGVNVTGQSSDVSRVNVTVKTGGGILFPTKPSDSH